MQLIQILQPTSLKLFVSCVWIKFAYSEYLYIKDCWKLTTRLWKMSMSNSQIVVLAVLASYVDSSKDWLSDSNNAVCADLSITLEHNRYTEIS